MPESQDRTQLRVRMFLYAKNHGQILTHPQIDEILSGLEDSEVHEIVKDSTVHSVNDVLVKVVKWKIEKALEGTPEGEETKEEPKEFLPLYPESECRYCGKIRHLNENGHCKECEIYED